ncbi:MAG: hypoxanthine phosphoribosyltransferase [Armatimonadetes bacterium]|nr:hypoxanthine phosphoribosyltransferase [Armatimonadota bacterium]
MTSSDVKEVLITEEQIQVKVRELADSINRDYRDKSPVLVGVLNGAFVFLADLMRHLDMNCTVDFVSWSSYGKDTSSSGVFRIMKDLETNVESRHVLIVEDIIDTGLTLHYLLDTVRARKPASVKVAALLDKPSRRRIEAKADYLGFQIPDAFVVGYGLDFSQRYRNLPFIGVLKPEIYAGRGTPPDEIE